MENRDLVNISQLPPELLAKIFCFLEDNDLVSTSSVCKKFYNATEIELVWQHKCSTVLRTNHIQLTEYDSYFELYTKLLYPYGYLLGLWQPQYSYYGGVLAVRLDDNKLIGTEYCPDHNVTAALRSKIIFTVSFNKDKRIVTTACYRGYNGQHACSIPKRTLFTEEFTFDCLEPDNHIHPQGTDQELEEWLWEQIDKDAEENARAAFFSMHLLTQKFQTLSKYSCSFQCERLNVSFSKNDAIIQPGLFKGTYGSHGIEILKLDYDDNLKKAILTKVTGDPNVPAGKVSVIVDLSRPMVLTAEQQKSVRTLSEIDIPDMPPDTLFSQLPIQPFREPDDCFDRTRLENFNWERKTCRARFHSQGQIAASGYHDPSFTPGHWIVFDEDTFGHLWLTLSSLSVYTRVKFSN